MVSYLLFCVTHVAQNAILHAAFLWRVSGGGNMCVWPVKRAGQIHGGTCGNPYHMRYTHIQEQPMEITMSRTPHAFWDDLAEDLKDPEFLRAYVRESVRIATIDQLVNDLDEARVAAGLSKAELARAVNSEPAVIRRLFSAAHMNPTLGTVAGVAAALGLRVTLEPLPVEEREQVTEPLLEGQVPDRAALAKQTTAMRKRRQKVRLAY